MRNEFTEAVAQRVNGVLPSGLILVAPGQDPSKAEGATEFVELYVQHGPGGQIGYGAPGSRRYEKNGFIFANIKTPPFRGITRSGELAELIEACLRGWAPVGFDATIFNVHTKDIGLSDARDYEVHQTSAEFKYRRVQ